MSRAEGRWLRGAVLALVLAGLIGPIAAGLWQTTRAAFGVMPAIGAVEAGLAPFRALADVPGIGASLRLTLFTGIGATALSLALALGLSAVAHARLASATGARLLAPFLAAPHAAIAIGLAFVQIGRAHV